MKFILFCIFLYLTLPRYFGATPFNNFKSQSYIRNLENITFCYELEEFFKSQSTIYIDNVYENYQRFFYKLIADLPKSQRRKQLKNIVQQMDLFLVTDIVSEKFDNFYTFNVEYAEIFDEIFEYDAGDTKLTVQQFNDVYVENGVEELLNYVQVTQEREFIQSTGNGLRLFLILNRSKLKKSIIFQFKEIVDALLAATKFSEKIKNLLSFINKCNEILD